MLTTTLYFPNIFNYFRLCLILSTLFIKNPFLFVSLYGLASAMDIIDGTIARNLNKTSILGACLDMFSDRIGGVLIVCRILMDKVRNVKKEKKEKDLENEKDDNINSDNINKQYNFILSTHFLVFMLLIDILAHNFLFTHSKIIGISHKKNEYFINLLKIYYNKMVLIFCCVSNEVYFLSFYLYVRVRNNKIKNIVQWFLRLSFPGTALRFIFNIMQIVEGIVGLGEINE